MARALSASGVHHTLVHTGQHFDMEMSDVFFDELEIPAPSHYLGVSGGGHGDMTGRMLIALERVAEEERPDVMVVYGDTNSTLAGALVAAKLNIRLAHVEAGLRSFNRTMPEEINRIVTDHLSNLLFCPTTAAADNLAEEGIRSGVYHVGDVMYDAAVHAAALAPKRSTIVRDLGLEEGRYALASVHRAENTASSEKLKAVAAYLDLVARDLDVILPMHPRTAYAAQRLGVSFPLVRTISPIGYYDITRLLQGAALVLTDSGGLQKEAYFHRIPCITLRSETEWVETIEAGWNRLWTEGEWRLPRQDILEYGDGHTAERLVALMLAT
jgi:UDP-GlcNAc3NAcA epimerase